MVLSQISGQKHTVVNGMAGHREIRKEQEEGIPPTRCSPEVISQSKFHSKAMPEAKVKWSYLLHVMQETLELSLATGKFSLS